MQKFTAIAGKIVVTDLNSREFRVFLKPGKQLFFKLFAKSAFNLSFAVASKQKQPNPL
jgi:hypothetical protein